MAETAEPEVRGADQVIWLNRLEEELDNLRAALAWCADNDPPTGLRLAGHLAPFWRLRGANAEGRRWLDDLLARATAPTLARVT
ncbi:MAG TPA: hypothetical protein VFH48_21975, partial [Chloroflexota bacterium]|nr:hypothetical protein [Chloroflexota bacterium]